MTEPLKNKHVRNIPLDIILTILTCFLYNIYIQYKQCQAVNDMLKEYKYSFVHWLIFTILTCTLYHIYHEYRKSSDIAVVMKKEANSPGLISIILTIFGLSIINDAIQQAEINTYYGSSGL